MNVFVLRGSKQINFSEPGRSAVSTSHDPFEVRRTPGFIEKQVSEWLNDAPGGPVVTSAGVDNGYTVCSTISKPRWCTFLSLLIIGLVNQSSA
jgi:hypothetical protein